MTRQTMNTTPFRQLSAAFACVLMASPLHLAAAAKADDKQKPLVVICVRHAEKVDTSKDPQLSPAGKRRAQELAQTLRNASIEHIHSSDFIRTRKTAEPIAQRRGIKTKLYDPRDLPGLVKTLRKMGGRHLVVGHSNTTPALVRLLGGQPFSEIDEPREYDRLYLVSIGADGRAQSVLLRYGEPYLPASKK